MSGRLGLTDNIIRGGDCKFRSVSSNKRKREAKKLPMAIRLKLASEIFRTNVSHLPVLNNASAIFK